MKILYFAPAPTALPNCRALQNKIDETGLYPGMQLLDARSHYKFEDWSDFLDGCRHYQEEFTAVVLCVPQKSSQSWAEFSRGLKNYCQRPDARPIVGLFSPPPGPHSCGEMYDVAAAGATYMHDWRIDTRLLVENMARAAMNPPKGRIKPYKVGPVTLDFHTGNLMIGTESANLTSREFELLAYMARRPGIVFTKDALMTGLYQMQTDDEPDLKIIDVMVCKIRKKLESVDVDRLGDRMIRTEWGRGYRIVVNEAELAKPLDKKDISADGVPLVLGNVSFIKSTRNGRLWFDDFSKCLTGIETRLILLTHEIPNSALRASQYHTYLDSGMTSVSNGEGEVSANYKVERAIKSLNKQLAKREAYAHLQIDTAKIGGSLYFWSGREVPADLAEKQGRDPQTTAATGAPGLKRA